MNLAQALKAKSRLVQKISSLQTDIQTHNSVPSGQERKINVNELMEELNKSVADLIRLKLIVFSASAPMRETILTLAETKSRINFLKGIDTHEGTNKTKDYSMGRFVDSEISFESEYDIIWVREEIKNAEITVDQLQDELDVFNHKTNIEF